jgi:hypothetical protein
MTYEQLIKTISEIVNNEDINKNGLSLVYELPSDIHEKINRDIFYQMNTMNLIFEPTNIFEVEIGGILIKFIKKN